MGQGILLSGGADVDFMIHGVFSYELFGQTLWITTTHVCVLIVMLIIVGFCIAAGHMVKHAKEVPTGFQNVVELIVEMLDKMTVGVMGKQAVRFRNYIGTIFIFILFSNISGLLGLRPPTADFGTTFGLALITFVMIEYAWIKTKGFGIIKDLLDPFPVFLPINIISEFATPVSMSLRLFGNVTAGTIMLGLWYALMPWFTKIGIPAFLHAYFDFFSGAIQTYVFGMLTMVFVSNRYD